MNTREGRIMSAPDGANESLFRAMSALGVKMGSRAFSSQKHQLTAERYERLATNTKAPLAAGL